MGCADEAPETPTTKGFAELVADGSMNGAQNKTQANEASQGRGDTPLF